ncbi:hypothetical protein [Nitrospira moscoviensis]|uniref:Uncharacterized protein n=1 Tax=Nitrospira moscoviensis TaxID=42253 RepID=A0A0K2GDZ6_NITMO|nr:hypothetical protein [Nitrospira moscoviensis]ALA59176.1 hypothetical protein NITMOv2_2767 [Nitrospira moscoviensis]
MHTKEVPYGESSEAVSILSSFIPLVPFVRFLSLIPERRFRQAVFAREARRARHQKTRQEVYEEAVAGGGRNTARAQVRGAVPAGNAGRARLPAGRRPGVEEPEVLQVDRVSR